MMPIGLAAAVACGDVNDRDPDEEIRQQDQLQALIDQWQADHAISGTLKSNDGATAQEMSYCEILTHWKNNPQDFQGDTELFGLMLDMGCEHCWGC